ncbi:MAG: hypothetical protein ACI9HH_002812, partial [Pseudomonadota bacterium]
MRTGYGALLVSLLVLAGLGGAAAQSPGNQPRTGAMEQDVATIKQALAGNWE